jgi:hypothetical protein
VRTTIVAFVLFVLAALPCAATIITLDELHFDPPLPTSSTVVELRAGGISFDGGAPNALQMSVVGRTINLDLVVDYQFDGVILAVIQWGLRTPLGRFEPGTYQVVLRYGGQVLATRELTVLPLYDDPPAYDKALVPFLYSGPGAFGAQWVTIFHADGYDPKELVLPSGQRPNGAVISLTRQQARDMRFSLRFRDAARMPRDFGVRVPIVRTADTAWSLVLPDVPLDPRFRRTLRVYDIDGEPRPISVSLTRADGTGADEPYRPMKLVLDRDGAAWDAPAFLQLDLDSLLAPDVPREGRVDVWVSSKYAVARLWAMVSITDNGTQETTIVTPR